jgi:hypothetical protein
MRHWTIGILALLVTPAVAVADSATGPAAERAAPVIERGDPSVAAGLDLRLDPSELRAQTPPVGPDAIAPSRWDHATAARLPSTDRGLSFGMELKPRGSVNALAHVSPTDEPGVQDNLERWLEYSRVGVRGRYRF